VLTLIQPSRSERTEGALAHLLRRGRVGTITHVSLVDHRTNAGAPRDGSHVNYVQLRTVGIYAFETVRRVLGVNPVNIVARCTPAPWPEQQHGVITEAIVEMEGNIHVQYHGSLTSNCDEYALRIDGDRGVLRSSRRSIWWRKRGWPMFVPIWSTLPGRTLEQRQPGTHSEDRRWSVAMSEAAVESDRTGRVVRVADLLDQAGPVIPTALASGQTR
jgi:hypothetical protein